MNNPTTPAAANQTNTNPSIQNEEQKTTAPQNVGGDQKIETTENNVVKENEVVAA